MQPAQLIHTLQERDARAMLLCGGAILLLGLLFFWGIRRLRRRHAAKRPYRLAGLLCTAGVLLAICLAGFAGTARQYGLLRLDLQATGICRTVATLEARKPGFFYKGSGRCLLDGRWLLDGVDSSRTNWLVGERYAVEYLAHSGYIVSSTFVLEPDRLTGHETQSLQGLGPDARTLFRQSGWTSAILQRVSDHCDATGGAMAEQFHSAPCSVSLLESKLTGQYLLKVYQPQGPFVCRLVVDAATGEITHFWTEP